MLWARALLRSEEAILKKALSAREREESGYKRGVAKQIYVYEA